MTSIRIDLASLAALLAACATTIPAVEAQAVAPAATAAGAPAGLDFSGVRRFWAVAATLSRDAEPTEADWAALVSTPGYRLALVNLGPGLRDDIDLALKPSRRVERERVLAAGGERADVLRHLALAWDDRADLARFGDSLARSAVIPEAVALAARLLPPGATRSGAPPPVAVAIFRDDGYSLPGGIVIDLLNVRRVRLAENLGHEFHHSYVNHLARPLPPGSDTAYDAALRTALYDLRNEGIADLIDKRHPFVSPNPGLASYAARYNAEYARTPALMPRLDSILAAAGAGPQQAAAGGMTMQMLFWSNGHPNGAYIAREIQETFGADSLRAAALDPAEFLRLFGEAERAHGRADPLSAAAWAEIDRLDARYWKR
jgi:hypothetical protein